MQETSYYDYFNPFATLLSMLLIIYSLYAGGIIFIMELFNTLFFVVILVIGALAFFFYIYNVDKGKNRKKYGWLSLSIFIIFFPITWTFFYSILYSDSVTLSNFLFFLGLIGLTVSIHGLLIRSRIDRSIPKRLVEPAELLFGKIIEKKEKFYQNITLKLTTCTKSPKLFFSIVLSDDFQKITYNVKDIKPNDKRVKVKKGVNKIYIYIETLKIGELFKMDLSASWSKEHKFGKYDIINYSDSHIELGNGESVEIVVGDMEE